jgi:hypothetical protein
MIVDLTDAHWKFTPAAIGPSVQVVIEAEGRRFVATIDEATLPFLERFVDSLPRTGPVDLAAETTRVLGENPFTEEPPDRRPWYRKLFGGR